MRFIVAGQVHVRVERMLLSQTQQIRIPFNQALEPMELGFEHFG